MICVGAALQVWEPEGSEAPKQGCGCNVQGTAVRLAWVTVSEGQGRASSGQLLISQIMGGPGRVLSWA